MATKTELTTSYASVPGLFSQFSAASSLNLIPGASKSFRERLAPLGDKVDSIIAAINEDRDDWGRRLEVVSANSYDKLREAVEAFYLKSRMLVGIFDFSVRNGAIEGTTQPTPVVVYKKLSTVGADQKTLELSKVFGTSGVLFAKDADGKTWIQVQGRNSEKNYPHGGNLGCSPAGYFRFNYDDSYDFDEKVRRIREDPDSIGTKAVNSQDVERNIKGEAREELGIKNKDSLKVSIVGVAHDDTSPHYEILTKVESTQRVEELDTQAKEKIASLMKKQSGQIHPHDFTETYAWIPATPEAIRELILTAPFSPSTHIANWIAVGRELVAKEKSELEARQWQTEIIKDLTNAWQACGHTVAAFYKDSPQAFFNNLHKKDLVDLVNFEKANQITRGDALREIHSESQKRNPVALRITKYLDRIIFPDEALVIKAYAMLKGVIHIPADNYFDPRRTPQDQGLLSAKSCFEKLKEKGIPVLPGTLL